MKLGVAEAALERTLVEVDTVKSRFITTLFQSNATVIGRTIYFRQGAFNPDHESGLVLLAHEIEHVIQWQQDGIIFLVKYLLEYFRGLVSYLYAFIMGEKRARFWVHDQISYEEKAMAVENKVMQKIKQFHTQNKLQ